MKKRVKLDLEQKADVPPADLVARMPSPVNEETAPDVKYAKIPSHGYGRSIEAVLSGDVGRLIWTTDTTQLKLVKFLARGSYGAVAEGCLQALGADASAAGEKVAVKVQWDSADASMELRQFRRLCPDGQNSEARHIAWFRASFPLNLGKYAYHGMMFAFYDRSLVKAMDARVVSHDDILRIMSEMVEALVFFHGPIRLRSGSMAYNCHLDLHAGNILVRMPEKRGFLTDFGYASRYYEYPADADVWTTNRTRSPLEVPGSVVSAVDSNELAANHRLYWGSRRSDLQMLFGGVLREMPVWCTKTLSDWLGFYHQGEKTLFHPSARANAWLRHTMRGETLHPGMYRILRRLYEAYDALAADVPYAWIQAQLQQIREDLRLNPVAVEIVGDGGLNASSATPVNEAMSDVDATPDENDLRVLMQDLIDRVILETDDVQVILRDMPHSGESRGHAVLCNKITGGFEDVEVRVYLAPGDAEPALKNLLRLCSDGQNSELRHLPWFHGAFRMQFGRREYQVLMTALYPVNLEDAVSNSISRSDYFRVFSEVVAALQYFHQPVLVDGEMTYNCIRRIDTESIKVLGGGQIAVLTDFEIAKQYYEYPAGSDVELVDRAVSPRLTTMGRVRMNAGDSRRSDLAQLMGLLLAFLPRVVGCEPFLSSFASDYGLMLHVRAVKPERMRAMLTDMPPEYAPLRDILVRLYSEYDALSGNLPYAWIQEQLLSMCVPGAGP